MIIILILISNFCFPQDFNGYYVGLEKMCNKNEKGKRECYDPTKKWYHLNHLYIDQDSAFLYQEPITLKNRDTLYSASDGAFYYFAGKINDDGENKTITFTLTSCDYCVWPIIIIDTLSNTYISAPIIKKYQIITKNNKLTINKVRYSKKDSKEFPFEKRSYFFKIQDNKPKKLN
jgi:hypothetical protein